MGKRFRDTHFRERFRDTHFWRSATGANPGRFGVCVPVTSWGLYKFSPKAMLNIVGWTFENRQFETLSSKKISLNRGQVLIYSSDLVPLIIE